MLLKEIVDSQISYDAQDVLHDFEGNLVSMIKMQKGSRPLPTHVFSDTLDRKAYAVRSMLRRYGVELEQARSLIQEIISKYKEDLNQIFNKPVE